MLRLGVLVSGGGTNLQALIDAIKSGRLAAEVSAVVSSNPKAFAIQRAEKHGIDCRVIRKKNYPDSESYEKSIIGYFEEKQVELVITAGFMVVLSPYFVQLYKNRMMNIHPSLIPAFCGKGFYGLRVHEAVLESGVKLTGATVHFADEGTDTGPIILQKAVDVHGDDTPETLQRRVMENAEWVILPEAVRLFSEGRLSIEGNKVRIL